MSKKCLFCGNVIEDNDLFCDECGKKQTETPSAKDDSKQSQPTPSVQTDLQKITPDKNNNSEGQLSQKSKEELQIKAEAEAKIRLEYEISEKNRKKEERKNNPKHLSVLSLICSIISYPLIFTFILPFITVPLSIVLGVKGMKSTLKIPAILGIVLSAAVAVFYVWAITSA